MANKVWVYWLTLVCTSYQVPIFAQASNLIFQPEVILGHIVPNYQDYPSSGLLYGGGLSVHTAHTQDKIWQQKYPNAEVGLFAGFWKMGNDSIFGNEIALYPYVQFPLKKHRKSPLFMRVGLGMAHFSKHYTIDQNIHNIAVGSSFTWAFEGGLYWKKHLSESIDLTLSGKYLHGSNGHTQLPNFGVNSGALGIGIQYYPSGRPISAEKTPLIRSKSHHFQIKTGIGLHEFGGTTGPVNGPKYGVTSLAAYRNIQFNQRNRLKFGLIFRKYNSYATYIENHSLDKKITPYSLSFALGHEFILGYVGLDVDGLLHLYKPFYRTYFDEYGIDNKILFLLHRWLGARIGLNVYAIPPSQNPKTNFFLGAHLNTNNGEADFSSLSIGIERLIR